MERNEHGLNTELAEKIKNMRMIVKVAISLISIIILCITSVLLVNNARKNNPLYYISNWYEQLDEDNWMKEKSVECFLKSDLTIYQTGEYLKVTGKDLLEYTRDLYISEFSSNAKEAAQS